MARVTVEDCLDKVDNRFDLVLLAAHRAKQISKGAAIVVNREGDKNSVVALREIATTSISSADLKEDLIHSLQKHVEVDDPEGLENPLLIGSDGNELENTVLDENVGFESMSEEELLEKMNKLVPPEKSDDY